MTDNFTSALTDQIRIRDTVSLRFNEISSHQMNCDIIYSDKAEKCIKSLKRNSSPGRNLFTATRHIYVSPRYIQLRTDMF